MRKGLVGFLLVGVISLVAFPNGILDVYFINVGHGDAILIDFCDWEALLDAGCGDAATNAAVLAVLEEQVADGVLELAILSHPHVDHYGGFQAVFSQYEVWEFWRSFDTEPDTSGPTYSYFLNALTAEGLIPRLLERGDFVKEGQIEWAVLGPGELNTEADNDNENSLVFLLTFEDVRFLFTGDIEGDVGLLDIELPEGPLVLTTAHPESDTSTSPEFLAWANPELAVMSTNDENPPASEVLSLLGIPYYVTSDGGTVHVSTDGEIVWVKRCP